MKKCNHSSLFKKMYVLAVIGILPLIAGILNTMRGNLISGLSLIIVGVLSPIALIYLPQK